MNQERLLKFARATHVHNLFRPIYSGLGSILMFHRVAKKGASPRIEKNKRNEVSPEYLESLIAHFLKQGHEIVSLDRVHEILLSGGKTKRFISFTFDDGYEDAYSLAYPVFRKYGAPFAIYISTNYPDRKAVLWWYLLEDLVLRNVSVSFIYDGRRYAFPSRTADEKEATFLSIRNMIIRQSTDSGEQLLKYIFEPYGVDIFGYSHKLALDWNRIAIMSEDPLITVGAHTVNHYSLSRLKDRQAEDEILRSREIIENRIGKKVEHFSYPFGSQAEAGKREFELVKKAGFKTATTTRIGNIFPGHRDHLECLPRIPVSGDREDLLHLEVFLSGFIPAVDHSFRRMITS